VALRLLNEGTLRGIRRDCLRPAAFAVTANTNSLATWFESLAWSSAREHIALDLIVRYKEYYINMSTHGGVMVAEMLLALAAPVNAPCVDRAISIKACIALDKYPSCRRMKSVST